MHSSWEKSPNKKELILLIWGPRLVRMKLTLTCEERLG